MEILSCDFCFAKYEDDDTGMINECPECGKRFCAGCASAPFTCPDCHPGAEEPEYDPPCPDCGAVLPKGHMQDHQCPD
jgi:hypothetical protein